MFVKQFKMGGDRNFGYLVVDTNSSKALVIDSSYTPYQIYNYSAENGQDICYVLNTHAHQDHSNGNAEMEILSGIKAVKYGDTENNTGLKIQDKTTLPLGELQVKIIHTPGHTDDSICILVEDALFTGDTLFVGKVGGTDFGENARREYESLHQKLMILPGSTRVFPGHDVGIAPESTILNEKTTNPFLLCRNFKEFLHLKKNWLEYKKQHGIK